MQKQNRGTDWAGAVKYGEVCLSLWELSSLVGAQCSCRGKAQGCGVRGVHRPGSEMARVAGAVGRPRVPLAEVASLRELDRRGIAIAKHDCARQFASCMT